MRKRRLVIVPLIALCLLAIGCPKSAYRACLAASDDVASSVSAAIHITGTYYTDNLVNEDEKKTVGNYLTIVTEANMAFRRCAVAAHNAGSVGNNPYIDCAQAFEASASVADPASFGFKNPKAQAELSVYLKAVQTAINGIGLAIQNAKGGK